MSYGNKKYDSSSFSDTWQQRDTYNTLVSTTHAGQTGNHARVFRSGRRVASKTNQNALVRYTQRLAMMHCGLPQSTLFSV